MRRLFVTAALLGAAALTCCVGVRSDESTGGPIRPSKLNVMKKAIRIGNTPLVLSAVAIEGEGSNGAQGTVQPGAEVLNAQTGAVVDQRQINTPPQGNYTVATSNASHDAPDMIRTPRGGIFEFYGAASTYIAYHPPQAWICQGRFACEPFKFTTLQPGQEPSVPAQLQRSPEYLIPSVGISELSSASIGDSVIIGGQQQPTAPYGQSSSQAYISLHATPRGGYFDTAAGPWDFTSSHVPPAPGLEMPTYAPSDDAYFDFGITRASAGMGTVLLQIGGASCRIPVSSTSDAASDAAQIAASFQTVCTSLRDRFGAIQVQFDPGLRVGGVLLAPAAVGITDKTGSSPSQLPKDIAVQCEGAIACGSARGENTVQDVRGSGLHLHGLYGGISKLGPYAYYIMDVEQATGTWLGRGQSSSGLALVCLRTSAPQRDEWTWTDCAGRHPFTVSPRTKPEHRLYPAAVTPYLVHAPVQGYRGPMTPYIFNWSMQAQRSSGVPIIASVSAALLPDGNILFAHGCQAQNRAYSACFAIYDTHRDETKLAGTIDVPPGGGSLASIALANTSNGIKLGVLAGEGDKWGCGARGVCLMTYRYNAQRSDWTRESVRALGGDENASFPGSITAEGGSFVLNYRRLTGERIDLNSMLVPIQ